MPIIVICPEPLLSPDLRFILTQKVEDYAAIEQIVGAEPVLPESRKVPEQALDAIDTHAERIRSWLGVENGPLGDVLALLEDRGIKVIQCPLPQQVSGFSAYTEELGGVVIVNEEHAAERQYFTAIHELVHLIYQAGGKDSSYLQQPERGKGKEEIAVSCRILL